MHYDGYIRNNNYTKTELKYKSISDRKTNDKYTRSTINNQISFNNKRQTNKGNEDHQNNDYATNEMESDSITYPNNEDNDNRYIRILNHDSLVIIYYINIVKTTKIT